MSPQVAFRGLLSLALLASLASAAFSYALRDQLPAPLREFVRAREVAEPEDIPLVLVAFAVVIVLALLLSVVGLYLFWKPARAICMATLVLGGPLIALTGPHVEPSWAAMMETYSMMLAAAVVAMAYCSPYRELFHHPVNKRVLIGVYLVLLALVLGTISFAVHHTAIAWYSRPAMLCGLIGSVLLAQAYRGRSAKDGVKPEIWKPLEHAQDPGRTSG